MDPFNIVKADVQESVVKAQMEFSSWQRCRDTSQKKELMSSIEDECKSIGWQVEELSKALDAAEKNTARFNLTQNDVAQRRQWILQTAREAERMLAAVTAPQPRQHEPSSPTRKLNKAIHEENERFIGGEGDRQMQMVRQQDDDLDQLGESVQRIGHLGLTIHEELEQQGAMIEELDDDVEGTSARLAAAQKRIQHVLAKAGMRGQLAIVVFLIVVLVVLVMFAFT